MHVHVYACYSPIRNPTRYEAGRPASKPVAPHSHTHIAVQVGSTVYNTHTHTTSRRVNFSICGGKCLRSLSPMYRALRQAPR